MVFDGLTMTSRRKLEEEIARTTDPTIRKQLQELLNKRDKRSAERISSVKNAVGGTIQELAESKELGKAVGTCYLMIGLGGLISLAFVILAILYDYYNP